MSSYVDEVLVLAVGSTSLQKCFLRLMHYNDVSFNGHSPACIEERVMLVILQKLSSSTLQTLGSLERLYRY